MMPKKVVKLCFIISLGWALIIIVAVNDVVTNSSENKKNEDFLRNKLINATTLFEISGIERGTTTSLEIKSDVNQFRKTTITTTVTTPKKISTFGDCLSPSKVMTEPQYIIVPKSCEDNVDLIWLIKSSIYRNSLRHLIRSTWGREIVGDEFTSDKM